VRPLCSRGSAFRHESTESVPAQQTLLPANLPQETPISAHNFPQQYFYEKNPKNHNVSVHMTTNMPGPLVLLIELLPWCPRVTDNLCQLKYFIYHNKAGLKKKSKSALDTRSPVLGVPTQRGTRMNEYPLISTSVNSISGLWLFLLTLSQMKL
jgi:hypothetical protein